MNDHTLQVLEFKNVLDLIKEFAVSAAGKSLCESLRPLRDTEKIAILLNEVSQLKEILTIHGDIPVHGIMDIDEYVKKAGVEGAVLEEAHFLDVLSTVRATRQLIKFFAGLDDEISPPLEETITGLISLPDLEREIERSIGPRGEILDSASRDLKKLRNSIKRLRVKIQNSLEGLFDRDSFQSFFQERIITIRNGRYVVPVKSDYKVRVQGIIHDHSHSKATYFIEPLSTIELNNDLGFLLKQEKDEELRILKNLTRMIREKSEEILVNLRLLGHLDLTYAKARYSLKINGKKPLLNRNGRVNLVGAYHPLLFSSQVKTDGAVPIKIQFDRNCSTLIITGANTGGKTVALKTAGLLTLMVQAGLHIPVAEHSEAAIFQSIFADIGDEQDIEQNLSTFSSHISQIVEILGMAHESSLVLLDEIGVGTDPNEGAGLAMAVLDHLREQGASIIATTHLELLKAYAYLHRDVMNVSVLFDTETMEPQYQLVYGASGESKALLIAEKLGVPQEILNNAQGYVEERSGHASMLIRTLEGFQRKIIEEKQEIERIREYALIYQQKMESLLDKIRDERDRILLETEAKAGQILRRTEKEAKEIVRDLKKGRQRGSIETLQRLKKLREQVHELKPAVAEIRERVPLTSPRKGDTVKILSLNKKGIIVNTSTGSSQVEVLIGNLRVKAHVNDLERVGGNRSVDREMKSETSLQPLATEGRGEINVVGMRVDDALPLVDKAIDRAILSGLTEFEIIHGIGTGRLREAIREHLKGSGIVGNFHSADLTHGGTGVTVVSIKE